MFGMSWMKTIIDLDLKTPSQSFTSLSMSGFLAGNSEFLCALTKNGKQQIQLVKHKLDWDKKKSNESWEMTELKQARRGSRDIDLPEQIWATLEMMWAYYKNKMLGIAIFIFSCHTHHTHLFLFLFLFFSLYLFMTSWPSQYYDSAGLLTTQSWLYHNYASLSWPLGLHHISQPIPLCLHVPFFFYLIVSCMMTRPSPPSFILDA